MIKTFAQLALVSAFAASGFAYAQAAAETTNTPQRAGEASTMTGGAPNAATTNETTTAAPADKAHKAHKADKKAADAGTTTHSMGAAPDGKAAAEDKAKAAGTSNVPDRAGEASTMSNGVPNKKTTN